MKLIIKPLSNTIGLLCLTLALAWLVGYGLDGLTSPASARQVSSFSSASLVTGILLLSVNQVFYKLSNTLLMVLLLIITSSMIVRYTASAAINLVGNETYWQMSYNGLIIYYLNACYLAGIILLLLLRRWGLSYFACSTEAPTSLLVILVGYTSWVVGLALYHSNELLQQFTFSLARLVQITHHSLVSLLSLVLFILYLMVKLSIALIYRKQWLAHPHHLLYIGALGWCLPLLITDTLTVLFGQLSPYLGDISLMMIFYLIEALINGVVFYLYFKKIPFQHQRQQE